MEHIPAKSILSTYKSGESWFGVNYNMNIYKGCCHGCIYCDSRSSCYQIEDFDRVRAKENAVELMESELRTKRKKGVIGTGAMSDPYNPFESNYQYTRNALKAISKYDFGVSIATKSNLITRDIDILKSIKKRSPVLVKITVTSADDSLCEIIEPRVVPTSKRIEAINELSTNGVFTGILLMPVLPFIEDTDDNILEIIRLAKDSGAKFIYPAFGVTLRQNQREYFFDNVDRYFDDKALPFKATNKEMKKDGRRLSKKYIETYGNSYSCTSKRAKELWSIFKEQCDKAKIIYKMNEIIEGYKNPYEVKQISLF